MVSQEEDKRVKILNSFLESPHGELAKTFVLHKEILRDDPEFYGHLATWYVKTGDVRDHRHAFIAVLLNSSYPGHRDAGCYFLRNLAPYEVKKVEEYYRLHLSDGKIVKHKSGKRKVNGKEEVASNGSHLAGGSLPSAAKEELTYFWWEQELDRSRMDQTMLMSRKQMRELIRRWHIPHSEYVDQVLFTNNPPSDSAFSKLKDIAQTEDPTEQAKMVFENKIPFRVAMSLFKKMTPAAWLAVIERMSTSDLINHMGNFQKRGVLENADLKALIDKKIHGGAKDKRVSALKIKDAVKAANLNEEDAKVLNELADTRVKAHGRIKKPTVLLVDKSSSLNQAIDVAKQLGALISSIMDDGVPLEVIAFDSMPIPVKVPGKKSLADWEKAFQHVTAQGSTACGAGLAWLTRNAIRVEQIVIITDEGENHTPHFVPAYQEYVKKVGETPHVIIIRVGSAAKILELGCKQAGISVDVHVIGKASDKYSLTNILPMLTGGSKLDVLMDVMSEDLPRRKPPIAMPKSVYARQVQLGKIPAKELTVES